MVNETLGPGGTGMPGASDEAFQQLRRRYDDLRSDYEALLSRLGDLEQRAQQSETREPALRFGILDQLVDPLLALRDEYLVALRSIQDIVGGLEVLASRGLKPQRGFGLGSILEGIEVDVHGGGSGQLLDFRDRLASMPGVTSVNIHAIDADRAVLLVELNPGLS